MFQVQKLAVPGLVERELVMGYFPIKLCEPKLAKMGINRSETI
ncbi:hypothetical protein T11_14167 [Trichinella zimbabwensis]|uniref:Uncharacterized protein n=1 Tax=Trichinella zimbabwensis TaxID=268475 RepID=A0A0V1GJ37_9BILA|nr:hypothetical protein T11_14167 [Trichinella zimbabwensis]